MAVMATASGFDLGTTDHAVKGEFRHGVIGPSDLIDPHHRFPDIRAGEQAGAPAGRSSSVGDHRVLVAPGACLGGAAEAVGQRLSCFRVPSRRPAGAQPLSYRGLI